MNLLKATLLALLLTSAAQAQEAVFLVRHAEKVDNSKDAELSDAGRKRAQELARTLRDAGITAVWATEFHRTQDTGKPLADAQHLTMKLHSAGDAKGLVEQLRKEGGRPLVVGHSNTLPEIAKALGVELKPLAEDEFDALFVIEGKTLIKLRQ
jgi:broad specificity phosphatase PhoE